MSSNQPFRQSRRSTRVPLRVVIDVRGSAEKLVCEGETIVVNLHGALISTPIPLTAAGLRLVGDFKTGDSGIGVTNFPAHCVVGKHVVVRVRATVGSGDVPTAGSLAMRAGATSLRPLVYVAWSPHRVRVYLAPSCNS